MTQPSFKDHFSKHAQEYARRRPTYPPALFEYLASIAPRTVLAWDCATGSGQAARALAAHFARVVATDASREQLASAVAHARVEYRLAPAEHSGLDSGSVDLVTVAQAVHWFEPDPFHAEVRRVLVPGGVIAVWCYDVFSTTPAIDAQVERLYRDIVGSYWPPERGVIETGYRTLPFPYEELDVPQFEMGLDWSLDDVLGYIGTWSATQRYRAQRGHDPLDLIRAELQAAWGDPAAKRYVHWPVYLRVGRVGGAGDRTSSSAQRA